MLKKIGWFILIVFVLVQFYPRPEKNTNDAITEQDITRVYPVPADVAGILKSSCNDCHSNNTYYPWYAQIQPVALWLNDHIQEGKGELNFSEFGSYDIRRQYRKLEEINEMVKNDEMPLKSYTIIHRGAKLSGEQKLALANWVTSVRSRIEQTHTPEELKRKK